MKKIISLLLSLVMILSAFPALAEGADIRMELPTEIHRFFSSATFNGYTIYPDSFAVFEDTPGGDIAFAVTSKGSTQILYGFEKKNGVWVYWLKNGGVLPQVPGQYQLSNAKGGFDLHTDRIYEKDTLCIALLEEELDYYRYVSLFSVNDKGQWHLTSLSTYLLREKGQTSARVYSDHLAYYNEADLLGHAWGVVETNLRYVSFSAFPGTLEEARQVLSTPPDIPYGSQLSATQIQFTGGQKFEVYSGPGTEYERAANGKAMVSTNDWIQVFGREGDYILIQYDITSDQMRFGYILASALPKNASVSSLQLDLTEAVILQNTYLTDDPLKSQTRIRTLNAGESGVKWLATMGAWAYVEVSESGKPVRGFVPIGAISQRPEYRSYAASYTGVNYTAQATLELTDNVNLAATILVQGGVDPKILSYQIYANNLPVSAALLNQDLSTKDGYTCIFTLDASLPFQTTLLGLCPVYPDGPHPQETIIISLY
ncbi:MAG: hypothetical protein E7329_02420 [Clostridiales bacterium]|nr:hypothetical protein [Clostridiales bacterium]